MEFLAETDAVIWTLHKDARTATAVMRVIRNFGVELRVMYNECLRVSRLYLDESDVLADAGLRRRELESRGWCPGPLPQPLGQQHS
jgi:hypothetical protein